MVLEEDPGHPSHLLIVPSHLIEKEALQGAFLVLLGKKSDQFLLKGDTVRPEDLSVLGDSLSDSPYLQDGGLILEGDLHHVRVIDLHLL